MVVHYHKHGLLTATVRRANQMADLESTVTTLRSDHHELEDRIAQLEAHEASLSAWVRDLESALSANGQRDHVESLRRMWAGNAGVVHTAPETSSRMSADPLATLATAASSFSPPSRTDLRRWEDEQASRKRRRYEEYEHPHPTHSTGITATPGQPRLPSPTGGRMRIDQLVSLPLPRLNQTSTSGSMTTDAAWNSWNHIPADNTIHYDAKPRVSQDARDIADRPHSASSSAGTTRTWNSPVQSFEIRL